MGGAAAEARFGEAPRFEFDAVALSPKTPPRASTVASTSKWERFIVVDLL